MLDGCRREVRGVKRSSKIQSCHRDPRGPPRSGPARCGPRLPPGLLPQQPCWIPELPLTPFPLHGVEMRYHSHTIKRHTPFDGYSLWVFRMITRSNPKHFLIPKSRPHTHSWSLFLPCPPPGPRHLRRSLITQLPKLVVISLSSFHFMSLQHLSVGTTH